MNIFEQINLRPGGILFASCMPPLYRDGECAMNRPPPASRVPFHQRDATSSAPATCRWVKIRTSLGGISMHRRGELQRRVLMTAAVMFLLAAPHSARASGPRLPLPWCQCILTQAPIPPPGPSSTSQPTSNNIDAIVNPDSGPGTTSTPTTSTRSPLSTRRNTAKLSATSQTELRQPRHLRRLEARHPEVSQPLRRQELRWILYRSDEHHPRISCIINQSTITSSKIVGSSYTVIGNPGSPFIFPLSADQVLSTADQLVIFEGPNTAPKSWRSWVQ